MARQPRRYAIHLMLRGGHRETVHFDHLEAFQQWYQGVLTASGPDTFINVPLSDLDGEYLVLRPSSVQAIRVEPIFHGVD
ncbi:MAG: hypothetical protein VKN13_02030 [Cyanobacteriota bacterium]|nr:hypothetical protein [Cyanobacteriota bacterium]